VEPANVPDDLVLLAIELPDDVRREEVEAATLPVGWNQVAEHPACQDRGDAWLAAGASAALEAPSAPIPEERNVIINTRHPECARVVEVDRRPFVFDPRVL
jgi:RES domain-containing protein